MSGISFQAMIIIAGMIMSTLAFLDAVISIYSYSKSLTNAKKIKEAKTMTRAATTTTIKTTKARNNQTGG